MSDTPCCAHSRVVLKHNEYPGGTRSDYWECDSGCGKRFWPDTFDPTIRNHRNWIAGHALHFVSNVGQPFDQVANMAYSLADAMILESQKDRSKPNPDWIPADSSHGGECGHYSKSPK